MCAMAFSAQNKAPSHKQMTFYLFSFYSFIFLVSKKQTNKERSVKKEIIIWIVKNNITNMCGNYMLCWIVFPKQNTYV